MLNIHVHIVLIDACKRTFTNPITSALMSPNSLETLWTKLMAGLNSGGRSSGSYRPIFAKAFDDFFTKFDTCTAEIIMKSTIFNTKY